ncbi:MAG: hypothetical protein L0229_18755 [Blastocatellia bacterium]|nr:hypothetical protein [Blastocatellia bacterium]
MKDEAIKEELLIRYALGQLNEEERERVEEQIFADREFFERLLAVEDELIDAYASGRLTGDDRPRFEKYLLQSDEDRERVEFARELSAFVSREPKAEKPKARFAWFTAWGEFMRNRMVFVPLAVSILLALIGSWLWLQTLRLNGRLAGIQAEKTAQEKKAGELEQQITEERRRNEQLAEELRREREQREREDRIRPAPEPPARSFVSFILTLGAVRDRSSTTKLTIPSAAKQVRLEALFKIGDYPSYRAELQTVEGRVLSERTGLKARKRGDDKAVSLTLPASVFGEGDYILVLNGITSAGEEESVGEYFFRVVRE